MWSIKWKPSNLSNWISFLRKMHFSNESRKRKTNFSWPLTLIMQKRDHFRLLRHHYSESPVIPLSNDIWYRCVAHGFITFYFLIFYRWSIVKLRCLHHPQGLVTIHVNILSMYKHVQGRTPFFTPVRFKSCSFFKLLLIYSKPCLVQLPRPYSFQKNIMTSPRLPLVKAQRSFLSGIRRSRELHGPKVKLTTPPIKKTEVRNSLGFTIRYLVFSLVIVF